MEDRIWDLVLGIPNFVGFVVLAYVLVRYVIQPGMEKLDRLADAISRLDGSLRDWMERHPLA